MKYRIFFIIAVLWLVALLEAGHPPLTLYYHPKDEKYVLTNPQDTSQLSDLLFAENPRRPKVIYCCPVETEDQHAIQEKSNQDVDKKFQALFVKEKKNPNDATENVECTHEYQPSARREPNNQIIIGYAIHEFFGNEIDWPTQNRCFDGFIWVFEKQIGYNFSEGGAVRSIHYIFPKQHTSNLTCFNNDLGSNIIGYTKEYIDRIYDKKNQNTVLMYTERPRIEHHTENVATNVSKVNVLDYVVPHQLIPVDDFIETYSKMGTCSYANSIAVWSSIHEGSLKNVERYIRKVADNLPTNNSLQNKLKVRTIVKDGMLDRNFRIVYLDHEKYRYPLYRMIVKVVSYLYSPLESNQQQELQEKPKERHLYIAIVIHNELHPKSTLCKVNICGEVGWRVASVERGLTYCCSLNDLPDLVKSQHIPDNHEPFNLNEILQKATSSAPPTVKVAATNSAIILLYYPQEGTYKYANITKLLKLSSQSDNESQFSDILLYCPPETIDEKVSATMAKVDNLMFVRKVVKRLDDIDNSNICVNHYQPAIWQNSNMYRSDVYHVGYLVSEHEASMKTQYLRKSPDKWESEYRGVTLFWVKYQKYVYEHNVNPLLSEHVMTSRKQSIGSYDKCKGKMKFGLSLLPDVTDVSEKTFIDAYSKQNQIDTLNFEYVSSKYYFVEKQLVPIDDFDDDGQKLATCTYMNIYPVWNIVNDALLGVENYLRKILFKSKLIDEFYIHTRLIDRLSLPVRAPTPPKKKKRDNSPPPSPQNVYLDAAQKIIPVPAHILKIIGHRVPLPRKQDQNTNEIEYKYYFMPIVFQNDIKKDSSYYDRICKIDTCTEYGWNLTEWGWGDNNSPFCCDLSVIPFDNEKLPFTAQNDEYEMLNLKEVLIKFDEQGVPQYKDIASMVNHLNHQLEEETN